MNQKELNERLVDFALGKLSGEEKREMELYLAQNPLLLQEVEALKWAGDALDNIPIPKPSKKMDEQFYAFLKTEKNKATESSKNWWETFWNEMTVSKFARQMAFGAVMLAMGLWIGNSFTNDDKLNVPPQEIAQDETEEVRSQLVLALIDQPSANKRLQAVNEATKLDKVTKTITDALFEMLNNDPNVNVRLATVEALARYIDINEVREGLVKSIVQQESPLVQIALADLMVSIQEKKSIDAMKNILKQKDLDNSVKQKIEASIEQLI